MMHTEPQMSSQVDSKQNELIDQKVLGDLLQVAESQDLMFESSERLESITPDAPTFRANNLVRFQSNQVEEDQMQDDDQDDNDDEAGDEGRNRAASGEEDPGDSSDGEQKPETDSTEGQDDREFETVFWSQFERLKSQTLKKTFDLPSHVKTFRVRVLGMDTQGLFGSHTSWLTVNKPFNVRVSAPAFLRKNETGLCKLTLENNTGRDQIIEIPALGGQFTVAAESVHVEKVPLRQTQSPLDLEIRNLTAEDTLVKRISVPGEFGLTRRQSFNLSIQTRSDQVYSQSHLLELPEDAEPGSLTMTVEYKSLEPEFLLQTYERLVTRPAGSNINKLMTLFHLRLILGIASARDDKKALKLKFKAEKLLRKGVAAFLKCESRSTGGFGLYAGRSEISMTAFAVWNLLEYNQLGHFVDQKVLDRCFDFLRASTRKALESDPKFFWPHGRDHSGLFSNVYVLFLFTHLKSHDIRMQSIFDDVSKYLDQIASQPDQDDCYYQAFFCLLHFGEIRIQLTARAGQQGACGDISGQSGHSAGPAGGLSVRELPPGLLQRI